MNYIMKISASPLPSLISLICPSVHVSGPAARVRRLHGLGDAAREDPRAKRLALHRHERLQRGDHERAGGGALQHRVARAHARLRHGVLAAPVVNHHHAVLAICTKGQSCFLKDVSLYCIIDIV